MVELPKIIEWELGTDNEDQRQILEDPTWNNIEATDPYVNM
ncbi:hypothetical protein BFJ63_vAg19574 [Fusarium oxysporum f. sp. narcissi]|uniref:Uncharacterized protein n=1 Tax=Fusarium oxysporum f. sp. narcissi TaxID=451672 RepID=A0A4Q2UUC8_FUSOX|nr:hypothetical protein BFJ63_vAg19574 [Fusarium oxysporum f. sp. narcissi]